jgi:hypothetical protein
VANRKCFSLSFSPHYSLLINFTVTLKKEKRNAKGEIKNTTEIQEIIRDYSENLNSNKFEHLEEMKQFVDTYDHPKLNQEDINHLDRSITQNEIEAAIKSLPKKKIPGPDGFSAEFYHTFRELIPTLLNLSHKTEREETLPNSLVLHSSQNQTKTPPKRGTIDQSP